MNIPWQDIMPDADSAMPLYLQMAGKLTAAIRGGAWQAGDALPSERTLASALKVSRITMRRAMTLLVRDGLVRRVRGSGTFIAPPAAGTATPPAARSGVRCVSRTIRAASDEEARLLGLAPGERVAAIQRLRYVGGVAVALEALVLPASLPPLDYLQDYYELTAQWREPLTSTGH
ncbi:GntR family transcriptional regulator [Paraburkholderia unamae]|uniref:UTRA domain-containing protein n=1 Tax=Paraburkholderia unamae TaxID=219649 RepID=A0ABX5KIJ4_9BURK|nr:GntR family transcriptional regulator [Paraburkholderia unamae]PVX81149.1 UTRA domain-containing protein [Paraburkholderia unamae]RAR53334.1 UTRA domain-containing protein [Paraburkholderia unamae]